MKDKILFSLQEVDKVVEKYLLPKLATHRIFTFQGPLGAGKTTMAKSLLRQAGVKDIVTSPTFMYVQCYNVESGKYKGAVFNHFDLYRLTSQDSFFELGFDEYLEKENNYAIIEWPEVINNLLQEEGIKSQVCKIKLDYLEGDLEKRSLLV